MWRVTKARCPMVWDASENLLSPTTCSVQPETKRWGFHSIMPYSPHRIFVFVWLPLLFFHRSRLFHFTILYYHHCVFILLHKISCIIQQNNTMINTCFATERTMKKSTVEKNKEYYYYPLVLITVRQLSRVKRVSGVPKQTSKLKSVNRPSSTITQLS